MAQANQLVLTQQDRYVMISGNIGLPATKFEAALAVFARNGIAPEQAATEGFCVAHMILAELELAGRPVGLDLQGRRVHG